MSETNRVDYLTPGRRTVTGYLHVLRGHRKGRLGILDHVIIDAAESVAGRELAPRWPDCHAVWSGRDPSREQGKQLVHPFLRYKASRPIDGLSRECNMHLVELTCAIGRPWDNGLGAYITRAKGRCIDPEHKPRGEASDG